MMNDGGGGHSEITSYTSRCFTPHLSVCSVESPHSAARVSECARARREGGSREDTTQLCRGGDGGRVRKVGGGDARFSTADSSRCQQPPLRSLRRWKEKCISESTKSARVEDKTFETFSGN